MADVDCCPRSPGIPIVGCLALAYVAHRLGWIDLSNKSKTSGTGGVTGTNNRDGTYDVVIRDPSNPSGREIASIKNMTERESQRKIESGQW